MSNERSALLTGSEWGGGRREGLGGAEGGGGLKRGKLVRATLTQYK